MGLMAYQQAGISIQNLDNSPYDISYDPANYNPSFTGARDSITKRYRAEKADDQEIMFTIILRCLFITAAGR